jgi:hypothetical protein
MSDNMLKACTSLKAFLAAVLTMALVSPAAADQPNPATPVQTYIYSLAEQAATYAVPIVAMYNLRYTTSFGPDTKARPNQIWRIEDITTPAVAQKLGYVTPNVNVVYGFGFMDLRQQPIILKAPDSHGRYYMVEIVDMWTNDFAYVGGTATGYKGGTFAVVGPGWHGTLPAGVKRIDAPTRWVELQPRVHVKGEADLAAAQAVLRGITVEGLAQYEGRTAPPPLNYHYAVPNVDPKVASSHMPFADPLQFWEIFSAAMNENPPPKNEIAAVLPQFGYLGIALGKQWKRENVKPVILEQMKEVAAQIGPTILAQMTIVGNAKSGWVIPPANTGLAGADYPGRATIAVFGLTANTTAEAIYYAGSQDDTGQPLTGAKRYTITFTPPMDYITPIPPGFWSLTAYDSATSFTLPNPINRYALGSDDNLKRNNDGSFTLYLQHDDPGGDNDFNWLPTPSGQFYLTLRNYAPVAQVVKELCNPATFQGPPPIVPVNP